MLYSGQAATGVVVEADDRSFLSRCVVHCNMNIIIIISCLVDMHPLGLSPHFVANKVADLGVSTTNMSEISSLVSQ